MARLNEILVGRFNRGYQKLFGIKGGPPVATLAPEIMPSHVLFSGAEERYPQGWNRFWARGLVAASVGNAANVRLRNPVGSNILAVIERVTYLTAVADTDIQFQNGAQTADLSGIVGIGGGRLDPRGNPKPVCVLSSQAGAALGLAGNMVDEAALANSFVDLILTDIQEVPLLPGDAYQATGSTLNTQVIVGWLWRERFLEEGERI